MVNWIEITPNRKNMISAYEVMKKQPVKLIYYFDTGEFSSCYCSFPISKCINDRGWVRHNPDGPATLINSKDFISKSKSWYWYGIYAASDEELWLDLDWRKRVEMRLFL